MVRVLSNYFDVFFGHFFFCVRRYRAIQISNPVDVKNRAVFSRSAAIPHSLVLRSVLTGQVSFLWAVNSGWAVLLDVCWGLLCQCAGTQRCVGQVDPSQVGTKTAMATSQAIYDGGLFSLSGA